MALTAIDETRFVPAQGKKRLHSMIEQRPDWCVSRQRAWGVPIGVFVNKKTGQPLRDQKVMERIVDAFEKEGADAWYSSPPSRFLGNEYNADDYEQVKDIVEVWFDSGSTHAFVLEPRKDTDLAWPADLYLEGSDQHRGWFHSSLLESCGTRGRAPYKAVLTHGFTLDEQGRKMSKSLGNVRGAAGRDETARRRHPAPVGGGLRLCRGPAHRPQHPEVHAESYRRLRNTFRYLLGALEGFEPRSASNPAQMPELERWVLHRLAELDDACACARRRFRLLRALHGAAQFLRSDLSAFYFDIRKDSLYCDTPDSLRRRAVRTVFDRVFTCLVTWLAPVLCFTAEEAWQSATAARRTRPGPTACISAPTRRCRRAGATRRWRRSGTRSATSAAWSPARSSWSARTSRSAPACRPIRRSSPTAPRDRSTAVDLAEISITSAATLQPGAAPAGAFTLAEVPDVAVVVELADGDKCERCWHVLPEVGDHGHDDVCGRCAEALGPRAAAE